MITDYYSKTTKTRVKETIKEQDTPQDKKRLKITPLIQEIQDKEQHRRATTSHRKAIPKEQEWGDQVGIIEGYDDDGHVVFKSFSDVERCCYYFREALRHHFTSPEECMAEWMSIQQNNTQYCVTQRAIIMSEALKKEQYFASKPTLLKALKRTLQEMLGIDRWYGTMPIVCMIVWILRKTTDLEEVIAAIEKKERKRKRKRKKEQKRKERNAELRRRKKAREIAYYDEEVEYYHEERAAFEEQYDDEQCAIYHRSYIHRGGAERYPQAIVPEEPTSQDSKAQQMGDGNDSAQDTKGRTSDGDRDHHLRDGATTRA